MLSRVETILLFATASVFLTAGVAAPRCALASSPPPPPTAGTRAEGPPATALLPADSIGLATVRVVITSFLRTADAAWPGYDLARRPFLTYAPARWAILVNVAHPIEGFAPYPGTWPALGAPALVHLGALGNLVGQLVFDLSLDSLKTAAVPLLADLAPSRREQIRMGFAMVVHEQFHQYQHDAFRSIADDQPEERYPILDSENTALASLELRLLMDAVSASARGDRDLTRTLTEEFLAVRRARWNRQPDMLPAFERPQELMEGTAKYVEVRSVGAMSELCRSASDSSTPLAGCDAFAGMNPDVYLHTDFESRLHDGVLEPGEMARNRVYPTGAAIGLLLDSFGVEWKARAADPARGPGLAEMLAAALHADTMVAEALVARAEHRYGYDRMRAACEAAVQAYQLEYRAAVDSFQSQPGYLISVEAPVSGLTRSRACQGMRWVMEKPHRSFSKLCHSYTLKHVAKDDLFVEVHESGIAEEADSGGKTRRVTFVAPDVGAVTVDGRPLATRADGTLPLHRLEMSGSNFHIRYEGAGTLAIAGRHWAATLAPPGR